MCYRVITWTGRLEEVLNTNLYRRGGAAARGKTNDDDELNATQSPFHQSHRPPTEDLSSWATCVVFVTLVTDRFFVFAISPVAVLQLQIDTLCLIFIYTVRLFNTLQRSLLQSVNSCTLQFWLFVVSHVYLQLIGCLWPVDTKPSRPNTYYRLVITDWLTGDFVDFGKYLY